MDIVNVYSDDLPWETASYHVATRFKDLKTERTVDGIRTFFVEISPGGRIMLHAHEAELYFILEGNGTFTLAGDEIEIGVGDRIVVPRGWVKGVANGGDAPLRLLAVRPVGGVRFYWLKLKDVVRRLFS